MTGRHKLLIVCFSFPPFPGIGGRRWAKFAKYLAQSGFEVHTLAAANPSPNVSEWTGDTAHDHIHRHTVSLGVSRVLSFTPGNFFEKVAHRVLWKLSGMIIRGNPVDRVFFIKHRFVKKAEEIIVKHNISTLIVTIPPYKLAWYLLPLKKKFPGLKFIVDYRDPWTDNRSYHGFATLSKERLAEEVKFEKQVLDAADAVMDVNTESLELLRRRSPANGKFFHVPNGFDAADYPTHIPPVKKRDDKIRFIYSGSFYPNLIYLLKPLLETVAAVKTSDPALYSRLEFNFYGNMDHEALALLEQSGVDAFRFHGGISRGEVREKIAEADYCLQFSALDHGSAFNTKFYEYLFSRKPIVYLGPEGGLADFIRSNNVGYVLGPAMLGSAGSSVLSDLVNTQRQFNTALDISRFDVKNITKTISGIIHG